MKELKMKTGRQFMRVIIVCWGISRGMPLTFAEVSPVNLSLPSGSFSTPTFPSHYPPATQYTWLINAKDGMYITLTFHVMDVEEYKGKCIDIVEIKDGDSSQSPFIGGYCNGNKPSQSITSSGNALRIWFQSARNSDGGTGFNASYITLKDEVCDDKQLRTFPGSLSTPRYPLPYPNDRQCVWRITAPRGHFVYVEFHGSYHLEVRCIFLLECLCMDILHIKDGNNDLPHPPHNGYCFSKPRAFTSKTNSVSLKFVSNHENRFEGFNVTYSTSLTPGCGADLRGEKGLISSPNFPHSYHSFRRCIWRITVATGHYVTLKFHKFDVNKIGDKCRVDSVNIHDGFTENSTLLAQLCNANTVHKIKSSGNQLYIEFTSGRNVNANGFTATYKSHLKAVVTNRKPRHNAGMNEEGSYSSKRSSNAAAAFFTSINIVFCWVFVLIL